MLKKIKDNLTDFSSDIKSYSTEKAAKVVLKLLKNADAKRIEKILAILDAISPKSATKKAIQGVRADFKKKGVWYEMNENFIKNVHPNCKEKFFNNFIINEYIKSKPIRLKYKKKYGEFPPAHIVISPIMRCNLKCIGCYASAYSKKDDLPRKYFEKAIREARDMGIYFITKPNPKTKKMGESLLVWGIMISILISIIITFCGGWDVLYY